MWLKTCPDSHSVSRVCTFHNDKALTQVKSWRVRIQLVWIITIFKDIYFPGYTIEDAISHIGFGRAQIRLVFMAGFAWVSKNEDVLLFEYTFWHSDSWKNEGYIYLEARCTHNLTISSPENKTKTKYFIDCGNDHLFYVKWIARD